MSDYKIEDLNDLLDAGYYIKEIALKVPENPRVPGDEHRLAGIKFYITLDRIDNIPELTTKVIDDIHSSIDEVLNSKKQ